MSTGAFVWGQLSGGGGGLSRGQLAGYTKIYVKTTCKIQDALQLGETELRVCMCHPVETSVVFIVAPLQGATILYSLSLCGPLG